MGGHHPVADQPVRPLPDVDVRRRRGPDRAARGGPHRRRRRVPHFFTIALRLLAPGIVTVLLFAVVATWNNYFLPLIMLSDPTGTRSPSASASGTRRRPASAAQPIYNLVITGSLLTIVPLVVAFLLLQRFWQSGLSRRKRQGVTGDRRRTRIRHGLRPPRHDEAKGTTMTIARTAAAPWRSPQRRPRRSVAARRRASAATAAPPAPAAADDLDAALEEGGKLTYWTLDAARRGAGRRVRGGVPERRRRSWSTPAPATTQYTKLQNAIKAGSGAPDVAQVEYYALPQFALADVARRPDASTASTSSRTTYTAVHVGRRARRRRPLRPAAGLRPDGAVLQQGGLRQARHRRCRRPGTSTSPPRGSCTPPTRRRTSPTTPATPASPPA